MPVRLMYDAIMAALAKNTAQNSMPHKTLFEHIKRTHPGTTTETMETALNELIEQRALTTCRITRGLNSEDHYWPTGLKNPVTQGVTPMSKRPESAATNLLRNIVAHGPIILTDLADKSGIVSKSIDAILAAAPNARNVIVTRKGFCAEKGRELNHYMTTTQAEEWDAREAEAQKPQKSAASDEVDADQPAAHVMSAPVATPVSTKQSEGVQVNESDDDTATESAELAEARRTIQSLHDSIDGMLSDWYDIRQALDVSTQEEILAEIGNLQRIAEEIPRPAESTGRLALLLIDSADLTEVEELDANCDPRIAQAAAMARIDHGHAARAVVVRIMGEAVRQVEWKAAA